MQSTNTDSKLAAQDSTIVAVKTANGAYSAIVANLVVNGKNAAGIAYAKIESVTATITGAGTLGTSIAGVSLGRSISVKVDDTITIWSDGNSGTGTITITGSTSGAVLGTKTVSFYGAMSALAGTVNTAILAVGENALAVSVGATDSAKAKITTLNSVTAEAILVRDSVASVTGSANLVASASAIYAGVASVSGLATIVAKGVILGDNWTPVPEDDNTWTPVSTDSNTWTAVSGDTNTWTPVSANDNTWTIQTQGSNTWLRQN
jgi:hypothetical protein